MRQPQIEPYIGEINAEVLRKAVGFRGISTVKALTDVRIFRHGEPVASFNGVFGFKSPDLIRTSFFGPFGLTVMDMLFTGELLQVHIPSKGALYEMQSPDFSFSSLDDGRFRYSVANDGEFYVLEAFRLSDGSIEPAVRYYFDKTFLLNRKIIVLKDGAEFLSVEFDRFNGRVPEMTKLSFAKGLDMEIMMQEPEYDSGIADDYFRKIDHDDNRIFPFQDLLRRFAPSR